jgi:PncC family amidohydrolase
MVSKIWWNERAHCPFLNAVMFGPVSMGNLQHLADEIVQCVKAQGLTICTAESCSAGRLALILSKTEGASKHFMGGAITYTKEMKARLLGVPPELIQRCTAVCAEVAEAMAQGIIARSKADLGVSITGGRGWARARRRRKSGRSRLLCRGAFRHDQAYQAALQMQKSR